MPVRQLLLASFLLITSTWPILAEATEPLEQLVIEMATTSRHHVALAEYYRGKADIALAMAEKHRAIADTYKGTKIRKREKLRDHCERIVSNQEALAMEYGELAALHEQEAKAEQ